MFSYELSSTFFPYKDHMQQGGRHHDLAPSLSFNLQKESSNLSLSSKSYGQFSEACAAEKRFPAQFSFGHMV